MTKHQAEQVAEGLRAAGWPVVYVEMSDDGKWRAVAEDPDVHDGWLMRHLSDPKCRLPPARQAPAPLKVYFYAGEDGMEAGEGGDWNKALNNPLRRLMFHNVACPMLNMFGPGDCRRFDHPFMIPNLEITFQPNVDIECLGYRLQDLVWIT